MASENSRTSVEGTPEAIFGVFAGQAEQPSGPWLFGEPNAPVIPATWLLSSYWDVIITTGGRGGGVRVRLSQEELATPGAAMKKLPRMDPTDVARACVEALSPIGSWVDGHLTEAYKNSLAEAEDLQLGDLPLLVSTFKRLTHLGRGLEGALASALTLRRGDILGGSDGALALVDIEMTLAHWLQHRAGDITWQRMRKASSLEEHAQAFATRFVSSLPAAHLTPTELLRRRGWGLPKATLEELGAERGVTRERIRQIFVIADKRLGERRWPLSPAVESATLRLLNGPENELSRERWRLDDERPEWTEDALIDLLSCLGHKELAVRVSEADSSRRQKPPADAVDAVRKYRDRLGFIDLGILSSNTSITESGHDPLALIRWVYPRIALSQGFVLAGTELPTPAERIAGQQFFVTQNLTPSELREGLVRVARKRAQPLPPPDQNLVQLLEQIGALQFDGERVAGPTSPLDEGSVQMWLYELIESSPGGVVHSEDVVRAAIRDSKNISSVMNYVSYEPIVRRYAEGSGLIRLVGRTVKAEAAELASRIATAQRRSTRIAVAAGTNSVELTLEVGSALLKNGVLNLPSEIVAIWPQSGVLVECVCKERFTGRRKIHGGGNVTGWQTALVHLVLVHGLQEGGSVLFVLRDEILTITDITP